MSIKGSSGLDFSIDASSTLFLDVAPSNQGSEGMEISLLTGASGQIDGSLILRNTNSGNADSPHRLLATDINAIQVNGNITALNLVGNPFGNSGTNFIIQFNSNSVYHYYSGANPFALAQPSSKVVFNTGSKYVHHDASIAPSLIGRTYADFEIDLTGTLVTNTGGGALWTVDNIIISYGTFNLSPSSGTNPKMDIDCKGNIYINSGQSFTIAPTNSSTLSFNGSSTQKIYGDGVLTFGNSLYVLVNNSSTNIGLSLEKDITMLKDFIVLSGRVQGKGVELTMGGNNSTITVNDSIVGTGVGIGDDIDLRLAGDKTNITGSSFARFLNITLQTGDTLSLSTGLECLYGNFDVQANSKLIINSGGYIANTASQSRSPNYDATSQLIYNSGGNYNRYTEWIGNTNPGYPGNVLIQNGTTLNTNNSIVDLGIQNDLIIGSSSNGNGSLEMSGAKELQVGGNIQIGEGAGPDTLTLSNDSGGDLKLDGDFTLFANGVFDANQRAVFFTGSANQTITSHTASNEVNFDYLRILKTGGDLLLNNSPPTTINLMGSGGDVLEIINGDLDLQGQTFNLGGAGPYLHILDGIRTVKSSTAANFNVVGTKEVRASNSGELVFNDSVTVHIESGVDFGSSGITTINGTLQIDSGGYANNNAPRYGSNAILKYSTGGDYLRRVEWNGIGTTGYPYDVIVANNTTVFAGGSSGENTGTPFQAKNDVKIENGSAIYMDYGGDDMTVPLIVGENLTINGDLSASDAAGGDVHVGGNWLRGPSGNFYPNLREVRLNGATAQTVSGPAGGENFYTLSLDSTGSKDLLTDITVNENLNFEGSGALSGSGQTITLLGDWHNTVGEAAFTETGTTVSFEGNALQNMNCDITDHEGFDNLRIENAGSGIVLNNHASISGELTFVDGLIDATAFRVDFENGATHSGSGDDSYINGMVRKIGFTAGAEFLFPVGQYLTSPELIDVYQPAALIPTSTSETASFDVDYNHQNRFPGTFDPTNLPPMAAPLQKVSTCNFWNIDRTTPGTNARVKLYWTDACLDINDTTSLVVAKSDGTQWLSQGKTEVNSNTPFNSGYVVSNVVTSFSPFAIGSTSSINVLPIQLLSFHALANGGVVETRWVTSTEINNDFFTIERSYDALNFEEIGRVDGAGNSTIERFYSFADDAPLAGISYYRLKQTDFDGVVSYSEIRAVQFDSDSNFKLISAYHSDNGLKLTYRSEVELLSVEIFDLLGKRIYTDKIENASGQSFIEPSLARGIYLLRLSNGLDAETVKFFY